jgi:hypothetical protein
MNGSKKILNKRTYFDYERQIFGGRSVFNSSPFAWILIAVVALATGLAIWQVPDDDTITESEDSSELRDSVIGPISRPSSSAGDALLPEGDQARAIIKDLQTQEGPTGQLAFEQAQQLQAGGKRMDAYLLYFFAARQGHSEAALELGTQADPAFHSLESSTLDFPDAIQAHKWYRVAAEGGNSTAERRLTELRNQIELQASTGNKQAQRLLLQWK